MINYKNLFSRIGDPIIKNYDFLKRFGTLHNLFLDLRNKEISTINAAIEQNEMIEKTEELKDLISLEEKNIVNKNIWAIK